MKGRLRALLWPPSVALKANRDIIRQRNEIGASELWTSTEARVWHSLPKYGDPTDVAEIADEVVESEAKRRETLEAKAASVIQGGGIATTIITLGSGVADKSAIFSRAWIAVIVLLYLLCMIHLLTAIYFGVRARKVSAFAAPAAEGFFALVEDSPASQVRLRRIVRKIAEAKWNEDTLRIKGNYLAAAEDVLLRGLGLFAISAVVVLGAPIWRLIFDSVSKWHC